MAQTVTHLSRDRLIQELKRHRDSGIGYPVPADHELARGQGDCVLEILVVSDESRHGRPASVTWSVHPRDGRFYDAGAAIGNTSVDQLCNRFPFLFEEPERAGWPGTVRPSDVKIA
jgi:hypothetical protein